MGRAIDMENDISALKIKIERLENQVRGMVSKLDEFDEKSTKTKHVDLVEEVGAETESISDKKEVKKANNKGNGKGDKSSNKSGGKSKSKTK
jgi:predicted  nucleic acid-binding Zn-ribbon protein